MFATLIIVLPSLYTGGEVHVTHASKTKVIDLSPNSLLSTCALAWYTDVKHEVKPVTSGYRLALSYNLIHTSRGVPIPSLPNMNSAVDEIRRVLHKWNKDAYEEPADSTQIVAYLLKHQYSPANLASGAATLKGEDAHKVAHLRPVAEELGYVVCLANLEYTMSGSADDDYGYRSYGGWKRHRYSEDYDDEDEGNPSMLEVNDESLTVENVVDLNGNKLLGPHKLSLDKEWLVPKDPFEGLDPDDQEYEGYMGNVSRRCSLSVFYSKTPSHRARDNWITVRLFRRFFRDIFNSFFSLSSKRVAHCTQRSRYGDIFLRWGCTLRPPKAQYVCRGTSDTRG